MTRTVVYSVLIVVCGGALAYNQLPAPANCRPFEVVTPGRSASDSVRIANRLVPRTQKAVQSAWEASGAKSKGYGFAPGERVLIYRDSQPRGSAIYDGCTLVPEQLPLPTFLQADSIGDMEILPANTVAQLLHDRRGYQHLNVTVKRPKPKASRRPPNER